jgi:hypothetical protein
MAIKAQKESTPKEALTKYSCPIAEKKKTTNKLKVFEYPFRRSGL